MVHLRGPTEGVYVGSNLFRKLAPASTAENFGHTGRFGRVGRQLLGGWVGVVAVGHLVCESSAVLFQIRKALGDSRGDHLAFELGEGGKHMPQEAALRAESQLGLVDKMHIDASLVELIHQQDGIAHAASNAVEGDGVDAIHAAQINDLAQSAHSGSIERRAGLAFVVETLAAPMQMRIIQRGDEILAGVELSLAGRKIRQLLDRLAGVDGVADGRGLAHGDISAKMVWLGPLVPEAIRPLPGVPRRPFRRAIGERVRRAA